MQRSQLLKFRKHNSTKAERKICEILKKNHIPFLGKWRVCGREVDFVIGKVILEIDGTIHKHISADRETMLWQQGYIPVHISIKEIYEDETIEEKLLSLIKVNNVRRNNF